MNCNVETDANFIRYLRGDLPTQHMEQITQQLLESEMMRYYLFGLEQTIYDLGMKVNDDLDTILQRLRQVNEARHCNLMMQIDKLKEEYTQVFCDIDVLEKLLNEKAEEMISEDTEITSKAHLKKDSQRLNNSAKNSNQLKLFGYNPIQHKPNSGSSKTHNH